MRIDVVDPAAYTPPYDHALCAALTRAGADVRLQTSRFAYGDVPAPEGYTRVERFHRLEAGAPGSRVRTATRAAQHPVDMLRYRRAARAADVRVNPRYGERDATTGFIEDATPAWLVDGATAGAAPGS